MKVENLSKEALIKGGSIIKEHKLGIKDEHLPIMIRAFQDGIYSDSIGSIIREITSNAVDAHIERDLKITGKRPLEAEEKIEFFSNKKNVIIEYTERNKLFGIDESIRIKDYGVGISPSRIENIFCKYFASTKRKDDFEIGGFGIGCKSPFAYSTKFYVTTNFRGKSYQYLAYKDGDIDKITLFRPPTETKEKNGTEVIIPLVDVEDRYKFKKAIEEQLTYFDNIVYRGLALSEIKDNKVILNAENFKVNALFRELHLIIGNVRYPLVKDSIDLNYYDYWTNNCFTGLKFKVGELPLSISRESIKYTDNARALIKKRLKDAQEEASEILVKEFKQIPTLFETFVSYYHAFLAGHRSSSDIDEINILYTALKNLSNDVEFKKHPNYDIDLKWCSSLPSLFDFYKCSWNQNTRSVGRKKLGMQEIMNKFHSLGKTRFFFKSNSAQYSRKIEYIKCKEDGDFVTIAMNSRHKNLQKEARKIHDYFEEELQLYTDIKFSKEIQEKYNTQKITRNTKEIPVKVLSNYGHFFMKTYSVEYLTNITSKTVYGFSEDDKLLHLVNECYKNSELLIIKISIPNEKFVCDRYYVKDFIRENAYHFQQGYVANKHYSRLTALGSFNYSSSTYLYNSYTELLRYVSKGRECNLNSFQREKLEKFFGKTLVDVDFLSKLQLLEQIAQALPSYLFVLDYNLPPEHEKKLLELVVADTPHLNEDLKTKILK